jgi:putative ABC transport system permease protein
MNITCAEGGTVAVFLKNLRLGLRLLGRQPGSSAAVVATFALGIGLTGTMFSLVHGASRELPFEESARLIHLEHSIPSRDLPGLEVPLHDFLDWRDRQASFDDLAAFHLGSADLAGAGGAPERYRAAFVTVNLFEELRMAPLAGRSFVPGDDGPGAEPVALLGHGVWRTRFAADPGIVGRTVRVDGVPTTVVGVMSEGFRFPLREDLWLPLQTEPGKTRRGEGRRLEVFGRLRAGVSLEQARLDLAAIARRLEAEHPETNTGVLVVAKPYVEEFVPRPVRALLWTMLGAVFGVLLIACVNVANLLLARTVVRSQEIALRAALGASRRQIAGQLLVETSLVAGLGLLAGLAFTAAATALLRSAIAATDPPFWVQFRVDLPVVLFSAGLTLFAALASVCVPALQASRQRIGDVLKQETRGASSYRIGRLVRVLVTGEIAVTLALLAAAGLMIRTIVELGTIEHGFDPATVLTCRIDLPAGDLSSDGARRRLFEDLRRRLAALPGVESAALASDLPVAPAAPSRLVIEGRAPARDADQPTARQVVTSVGWLETLSLRPLAGRGFGPQDREGGAPVALVDAPFAARFFPAESAVGRRLRLGDEPSNEPWRTIVGVLPSPGSGGAGAREPGAVYIPLAQSDAASLHLLVRTAGEPLVLAPEVRRGVRAAGPDLAMGPIQTLEEVIRQGTWHYRVFAALFLGFGAAALFLAAVGLGGVMAFTTSRRAFDIGVHRALGAGAPAIRRLVLRQVGPQAVAGFIIGSLLALPLTRALRLVLVGVEPWDVPTFLTAVGVLATACLAACALPVRRATRIDPAVALRQP